MDKASTFKYMRTSGMTTFGHRPGFRLEGIWAFDDGSCATQP